MEPVSVNTTHEIVGEARRTRRTMMDSASEYPAIGIGIIMGLGVVAMGIYKWRKNPAIATSGWLQSYRVGSSAPVVAGALISAMMQTPEKRKARRERYIG